MKQYYVIKYRDGYLREGELDTLDYTTFYQSRAVACRTRESAKILLSRTRHFVPGGRIVKVVCK